MTSFSLTTLNNTDYIEVMTLLSGESAFVCLLESHHDAALWQPTGIAKKLLLLATVNCEDLFLHKNPPLVFARSIQKLIREDVELNKQCGGLLYFGAYLLPDCVHLCWAGDIRACLTNNGKLTKTNWLHNITETMQRTSESSLNYQKAEYDPSILTKYLAPNFGDPESDSWSTSESYSLILVTSQIHQYRNPQEYLEEVLHLGELSPEFERKAAKGVILKVTTNSR